MTPRVFKTMIGDIFTTNCIEIAGVAAGDVAAYPAIGSSLFVGDDGYLTPTKGTNSGDMEWQVVKQYDLGDRQRAVKIMRIK